ncbi:MAG: carbonic anhydrase [Thermoplasmatota archaeon]
MAEGSFATAINCMDGRTQIPVNEWMKQKFGVDYVDTITEPGPNGALAKGKDPLVSTIKERVMISVNGHGSGVIALVGHHDCAGNPGPREMQDDHVIKGLEVIRSWELPVRLLGLWVGDAWKVEVIFDSENE